MRKEGGAYLKIGNLEGEGEELILIPPTQDHEWMTEATRPHCLLGGSPY